MDFTHDLTAVSGSVLTAAQWNTNVRDNLLQTAPALATAAGQVFVSTAANTLAARNLSSVYVGALETTTSTTFGNLSTFGPWTKFATGPNALVGLSAQVWNSTSAWSLMSYVMTYGTTAAASDDRAVGGRNTDGVEAGVVILQTGLNDAPDNQFTAYYRVTGGTGSWAYRRLWVMPTS